LSPGDYRQAGDHRQLSTINGTLPNLKQPLNLTISWEEEQDLMTTEKKELLQAKMPQSQVMFGVLHKQDANGRTR